MTSPDNAMCIDYRFLGTYSLHPKIAEAYENAPAEQKTILNSLERLYHIDDTETFVREAEHAQDMLGDAGMRFDPISGESMRRDMEGTIGTLEGYATQLVMGREEAERVVLSGE